MLSARTQLRPISVQYLLVNESDFRTASLYTEIFRVSMEREILLLWRVVPMLA